jgi:hypothetical protein
MDKGDGRYCSMATVHVLEANQYAREAPLICRSRRISQGRGTIYRLRCTDLECGFLGKSMNSGFGECSR